ncbi:hypothetical protein D9M71_127590 [compost metagenome]
MPVQIEQTSKRYKGRMLVGGLLCCVGVVTGIVAETPIWGVGLMVTGLVVYASARISAWWNHG